MKKFQKSIIEHNVYYRQKNGGWQIVISYKNEDGNWRQKTRQGFKSEAAARNALFPMLKELEEQLMMKLEPTRVTFEDFSAIIVQRAEQTKTFNTGAAYRTAIGAFSSLNKKQMTKITTVDIQEVVDSLEGIKESTKKEYLGRIHHIFEKAVKPYKLRADNPVEGIEIKKSKKPQERVRALTPQEYESLFKIFTLPKQQLFILLAGTCGLRCGEVLGLTWKDVDFKRNVVDINKQWKLYDKTHYSFGELKSHNSYREVPIPPRTRAALLKYKNQWKFNPEGRILAYCGSGYVNSIFRDKMRGMKLKVTPHDLRHTYATSLIRAGLDFKSVAKLLGHSVAITMNTYSHVTKDMDERSADVVNRIFEA